MKIQIVDEQDNLIGVKERSTLDYSIDIYRVAAVWITNSKGQVLLAKRTMTKDKDPGKWGPSAAGTMDEGETYEDNVYKEAKEEIGLEGVKFTLGPKIYITYPRKYFCQWYFAVVDREADSFTKQDEEVDELKWIDLAEFKADLDQNPDKYVPSMPQVIAELHI